MPALIWASAIGYRLLTAGLIAFCVLFGTPFLARQSAGQVIAWAGCTPPSFDMQAVCPPGSWATPFAPLSHWFGNLLAPFVLISSFGWYLLGGLLLALLLRGLSKLTLGEAG